jgi:hypothetical protein
MTLNDDVDHGLDNVDDLVVKPDEINQGTPSQVTIVTPEDNTKDLNPKVTPVDFFGKDAKVGEIPNFDATFKIVEENTAKTVDLKDIQEQLFNQATISQEEAAYFDQCFQGEVFKRINKKSFTHQPTRTNLSEVQRVMQEKVSLESFAVAKEIQVFFTQPAVQAIDAAKYAVETTLPALKEIIEECDSRVDGSIERLEDRIGGLFYTGENFNHFFEIIISKYDPDKQGIYYRYIDAEDKDQEDANGYNASASKLLNEYIKGIQLALKDHHLCSFLKCVKEHIQFEDQTPAQNAENMLRAQEIEEHLTFGELVKLLYPGSEVIEQFTTLEAELREVISKLENFAKVYAAGDVENTGNTLDSFLINDTPEVHKYLRNLHHILHILKNFYLLEANARNFVTTLGRFQQ